MKRGPPLAGCAALLCALLSLALPAWGTGRTWSGLGDGYSWTNSANWAPADNYPQAGDDITIASSGIATVLLTSSSAALHSFAITNATLVFTNWNTALNSRDVTIRDGGRFTLPNAFTNGGPSNRVYVICTNLTVAAGGRIDVDTKGYESADGPGKGESAYAYTGGGGHGGKGGEGSATYGGGVYGSVTGPQSPGSGGGNYVGYADLGGRGGGVVRIQASDTVLVEGTISANGGSAIGNYCGGGAGGSIYITCRSFGGSAGGLIEARGSDCGWWYTPVSMGGAGGGGRIAVSYTTVGAQHAVRFCTSSGAVSRWTNDWDETWYYAPGKGTLSLSDTAMLSSVLTDWQFRDVNLYLGVSQWTIGSLTVSNCALTFAQVGFQLNVTPGSLRVENPGRLGIGAQNGGASLSSVSVAQDLVVTNGGLLYLYAGATNDGGTSYGIGVDVTGTILVAPSSWIFPFGNWTNGAGAWLGAGNVVVAAGGGINADSRGYRYDAGPGKGMLLGSGYGGGGGHGGRGGDNFRVGSGTALGGGAYGSVSEPVSAGSGGGSYSLTTVDTSGGFGGGVLGIDATGSLTVEGRISANGGAARFAGGGAAGGSIFITCNTFGGAAGVVSASGGRASESPPGPNDNASGAGGGGRIAVSYSSLAAEHGMTFSVLPGFSYAWNTPGQPRAAAMGTLWFSDAGLFSANMTALNGYVTVGSAFTSWSPGTLTVSNAALGFNGDFTLNVTGDVVVLGTNGAIAMNTNSLLLCGGNLSLADGGRLWLYAGPTNEDPAAYNGLVAVTGTVTIASNSWIYPYCDEDNGGAPLFRMNRLVVAAGGGFSADGGGFGEKRGPGKGISPGGVYPGGAGHGGKGGDGLNDPGSGGAVYGSTNAPITAGSGGGEFDGSGNYRGAQGGGVVRIEVEADATVDGTISANSGRACYAGGGGGGGSVFLSCRSFTGAVGGELDAQGGDTPPGGGGGGGGGRIVVAMGLTGAERSNLLLGAPVNGLRAFAPPYAGYGGAISVVGGIGGTNLPPGGAEAGTALFLSTNRVLTIIGVPQNYDSPSPLGYSSYLSVPLGAWVTNAVTSPVDQASGSQHTCWGWRVTDDTGTVVSNGGGTQAVFRFTTNMVLSWLWTNEYELVVTAGAGGSVNSGQVNGWYTNGIVLTNILATPDGGHAWWKWTGDFPPGSDTMDPLTAIMDRPRTLQANFSSSQAQTNMWNGSNLWENAGNWSLGTMPGALDTAVIESGTVLIGLPTQVHELIVGNGARVVFTNWAPALVASNITVQTGGYIGLYSASTNGGALNRIYMVCTNLTVEIGGRIDADGKGYRGGNGPAPGGTAFAYTGGGGHGGKGGEGTATFAGGTYGSVTVPDTPGSGGGNYAGNSDVGGSGGGVIRIVASDTVAIEGTVSANGGPVGNYCGGGSGGSVFIACRSFGGSANGLIQARGSDCGWWYDPTAIGGGGGGGRIAVNYNALGPDHAVRFCTRPGVGWHNDRGSNWWHFAPDMGTLSLPDSGLLSPVLSDGIFQDVKLYIGTNAWSTESLAVNNCSVVFAEEGFRLTVTNGMVIDAGGVIGLGALNGGTNVPLLTVGQDLVLTNGGRLYVYSGSTNDSGAGYGATVSVTGTVCIGPSSWIYPYANQTNGAIVVLRMSDLVVATNGGLNADSKGYPYDQGPGKGNRTGAGYEGGGGHGGKGGDGVYVLTGGGGAAGGSAYGDVSAPTTPGSGGGSYANSTTPIYFGGFGGGGVSMVAANGVWVEGTITANGNSGGSYSGGGAGGSISIACHTFGGSGDGVLQARGGDRGYFYDSRLVAGGGGGGRIAVNYVALASEHDVHFSTLPGAGYPFPTPGDSRGPFLGTLSFPNTNLLRTSLSVFDGFVYVPGNAWSPDSLVLSNAALGLPEGFRLNVKGDILVSGISGMLVMETNAELLCGGNMALTNGGQVMVYSGPTNGMIDSYGALVSVAGTLSVATGSWISTCADLGGGGSALFRMNRLIIDAGGGFVADAVGYPNDTGPGKGTRSGTGWEGGAGYGGGGGAGSFSAGGGTYGGTNAPMAPGSGGNSYQLSIGVCGGRGGGVVRIAATDEVILNGTIRASGERGGYVSGGGSGGSVFVTCGGPFSGGSKGVLDVRGGNGFVGSPYSSGGGGGGRIAVWHEVDTGRRQTLLANPDDPVALGRFDVTNSWSLFAGALSADGGAGLTNGDPGTVVFIHPILARGALLIIQ